MNYQQSQNANQGNEINLVDYWHVIFRHKKMIGCIVVAASILAVIVSLLKPNIYRAEAVIIPVSSKGGGVLSSLASQFGGLASIVGVPMSGGENEKFITILKSRTLAENVIMRENLMPVFFKDAWDEKADRWKSDDQKGQPTMESAVSAMRGFVTVIDDKRNKAIKITGESRSPELAARVVNSYIDELQNFINNNAFTNAKRNRIFIESQIELNKRELLEASKEINDFYKGGRISSAESKIDVPLNNRDPFPMTNNSSLFVFNDEVANHQLPITNHEKEIELTMSQKVDIDKKITDAKIVKNVPQQVYLSYLMLRRELLAKVNALLYTQYEIAKIEESKEDLGFQVIDKAVPPIRKYKPKRAQICMLAFVASLFFSIFLAFFLEYLASMKAVAGVKPTS